MMQQNNIDNFFRPFLSGRIRYDAGERMVYEKLLYIVQDSLPLLV